MKNKNLNSKSSVIINTALVIMLMFSSIIITSCTDTLLEDIKVPVDNKEVVNSLNQTRAIGTEGFFENYVNIEDFKDFQFEANMIHRDFKNALDNLKFYDEFPSVEANIYTRDSLTKILKENCKYVQDIPEGFESNLYYDYQNEKSFVTNYDKNKKVEAFVEVIFEIDHQNHTFKALSPKEAYDLLNYQDRTDMRFRGCNKNRKSYQSMYIEPEKYVEFTGFDLLEIITLRVITFTRLQIFPNPPWFEQYLDEADLCHYIYQFPYKDNYKDYQNESLTVSNDKLLKKYIKPGTVIFVFDKDTTSLSNHSSSINSGHSIIITDLWYDLPDHMNSSNIKSDNSQFGYQSIESYKRVNKNQDFIEIDELRKDAFDDKISLKDYLKRFVFIEAITTSLNNNDSVNFSKLPLCVKYTTGNDEKALKRFDNYTVFALSNLNKGYKQCNTSVQFDMINYAKNQVGKIYNFLPIENDNRLFAYCSGVSYFGYQKSKVGISILKKEHGSNIKGVVWYMPRTITNSPFMYTRILYK